MTCLAITRLVTLPFATSDLNSLYERFSTCGASTSACTSMSATAAATKYQTVKFFCLGSISRAT